MEENKTEVNANTMLEKIEFYIKSDTLNAHMMAFSQDKTRMTLYKSINFRCKGDGLLHIASTDGRILFHTIINDCNTKILPEFNKTFLFDRPVKGSKKSYANLFVVIDGDVMRIHGLGIDIPQLFPMGRSYDEFPNYEMVEINRKDRCAPTVKTFKPEILERVAKYVPSGYMTPHDSLGDPSGARCFVEEEDGVTKIATVMPLRVN